MFLVRLQEEGVDHAVAEEWEVRALGVELGIGSVAVISPRQRVRDAPHDRQIKIVFAAHRFECAGKVGIGVGHDVLLGFYDINLSVNMTVTSLPVA